MGTGGIFYDIYKYILRDDLEVIFWIIGVSVPVISLFFKTVHLKLYHMILKIYKLLFKLLGLFPYRIIKINKIPTHYLYYKINKVYHRKYENGNEILKEHIDGYWWELYLVNGDKEIDKSGKFDDPHLCKINFNSKYKFIVYSKSDSGDKQYGCIK